MLSCKEHCTACWALFECHLASIRRHCGIWTWAWNWQGLVERHMQVCSQYYFTGLPPVSLSNKQTSVPLNIGESSCLISTIKLTVMHRCEHYKTCTQFWNPCFVTPHTIPCQSICEWQQPTDNWEDLVRCWMSYAIQAAGWSSLYAQALCTTRQRPWLS